MENPDRLIRRTEVKSLSGVRSNSHLYAMMSRGEFPRPRKISARSVGWLLSDVLQWVASRPVAAHDSARDSVKGA